MGSGDNLMVDALNCDIHNPKADYQMDMSKIPWVFEDNYADEIHMTHVLEHFPDPKPIIMECYRVLKTGGTLHIIVPHSSCAMAIGCMGHYRTYSYDTLNDYLSKDFYMFEKALFKTKFQALRWWYNRPTINVPKWMYLFIYPMNFTINKLAKISPRICENVWCYWVGGFREVEYIGRKI